MDRPIGGRACARKYTRQQRMDTGACIFAASIGELLEVNFFVFPSKYGFGVILRELLELLLVRFGFSIFKKIWFPENRNRSVPRNFRNRLFQFSVIVVRFRF